MATRYYTIIIALMAGIAHGQTYVWTNDMGQIQWSANRADAYLAVGAVVTSSVAPVVNTDPVPPFVYAQGIEVPYVVYLDATNRAIGIAEELIEVEPGVFEPIHYLFHASPIYWDKVESNRMAAINRKNKSRADLSSIKTNSAAANSIPALREQVRRLAELLEAGR